MANAYNMHANWRQEDPRRILRLARKHGGTITPYARHAGLRSWIVSWPDRGEDAGDNYCDFYDGTAEGHLYVVRCHVRGRFERNAARLAARKAA